VQAGVALEAKLFAKVKQEQQMQKKKTFCEAPSDGVISTG
jgi:hypothetical protein